MECNRRILRPPPPHSKIAIVGYQLSIFVSSPEMAQLFARVIP